MVGAAGLVCTQAAGTEAVVGEAEEAADGSAAGLAGGASALDWVSDGAHLTMATRMAGTLDIMRLTILKS